MGTFREAARRLLLGESRIGGVCLEVSACLASCVERVGWLVFDALEREGGGRGGGRGMCMFMCVRYEVVSDDFHSFPPLFLFLFLFF